MAIAYNTSIVRNGLVVYLDAANPKSYPGSGSTWYDLSGKNNHATLYNSPAFNSAGYFVVDGVNDYAQITNNATLDFSNEQTLMIFMRHSYTSGRRNPWDQAYGGYGTWTHEQGNTISQYFGDAGTNNTPYIGPSSPSTPRNVWNLLTATRNTSQHKWYLNTTLGNTTSHSYGTLTTTAANIRLWNGYAGYWVGDMALVLAYNRALTADEIKKNFEAFRGRFGV
jgi:hypothetical protein